MKKLVLIDGNAIIHRAFHALPPTLSHKGKPTNAVYGFFSMFFKILQETNPEYLIVCFDRPKPTFRQTLYAGYQQNRPKMSDDLVPQIVLVHETLEALKAKIYEVDGFEADDLIGTLAEQAAGHVQKTQNTQKVGNSDNSDSQKVRNAGQSEFSESSENLEVIIVSGDRDLLQLVHKNVVMLAPITGITKMIVYDERLVEEKYGVTPAEIVDYKALIGDASDGYPGVAGVGPKTAANLIRKYGSLEQIYQKLDEIKVGNEGLAAKLAAGAEPAGLAKQLATIVRDAPVTLHLKESTVADFDISGIREKFEEIGFKTLLKRLDAGFSGGGEIIDPDNVLELEDKPQKPTKQKPTKQKDDAQLELL